MQPESLPSQFAFHVVGRVSKMMVARGTEGHCTVGVDPPAEQSFDIWLPRRITNDDDFWHAKIQPNFSAGSPSQKRAEPQEVDVNFVRQKSSSSLK